MIAMKKTLLSLLAISMSVPCFGQAYVSGVSQPGTILPAFPISQVGGGVGGSNSYLFNPNQFSTNGLRVAISSGALLTNVTASGTFSGNGAGITNAGGLTTNAIVTSLRVNSTNVQTFTSVLSWTNSQNTIQDAGNNFSKFHVGDNIAAGNYQYTIMQIVSAGQVVVCMAPFGMPITNPTFNTNNWQLYYNDIAFGDINNNPAGGIDNGGNLLLAGQTYIPGGNYFNFANVKFFDYTNSAVIDLNTSGAIVDGSQLELGSMIAGRPGALAISMGAPTQSLKIMSNGVVAIQSGVSNLNNQPITNLVPFVANVGLLIGSAGSTNLGSEAIIGGITASNLRPASSFVSSTNGTGSSALVWTNYVTGSYVSITNDAVTSSNGLTGNIITLSNGNLIMPLGAQNAYVMTSSSAGLATWQPATGGGGGGSGLTNTFDNNFTLVQGTNVHLASGPTLTNANLSTLATGNTLQLTNTSFATNGFTAVGGQFTGNGAGLTNIPASSISGGNTNGLVVISSNWISGQLYTNLTGSAAIVSSLVSLTTAAVTGDADMDLQISGANTNRFGISTTVAVTLAQSYTNLLVGVVSNGGTFVFTNLSSGSGNTATLSQGQLTYANLIIPVTSSTVSSLGTITPGTQSSGINETSFWTNNAWLPTGWFSNHTVADIYFTTGSASTASTFKLYLDNTNVYTSGTFTAGSGVNGNTHITIQSNGVNNILITVYNLFGGGSAIFQNVSSNSLNFAAPVTASGLTFTFTSLQGTNTGGYMRGQ